MRSDPKRGEQIRGYATFESSMREAARSYWGEGFGRDSLSGKEANRFFLSRGGEQFADLSGLSGLDHVADGRALALLDFDRDGRQDLAVASANAPKLTLFHNEIGLGEKRKPSVALRLVGGNRSPEASAQWSNRDGIGARVTAVVDGRKIVRHLQAGEGLSAQNSNTLLIAAGSKGTVTNLNVRWPSGKSQSVDALAAGTLATFYENPAEVAKPDGDRGSGIDITRY